MHTFKLHPGQSNHRILICLLAYLLFACCSRPVLAQEWIYTIQPGDNLWNFYEEYLTDINYWYRLQKLNNIDQPHQMLPGSKIRVPVAWLKIQPVTAQVAQVQGSAELLRTGESGSRVLENGTELRIGDSVRTGPDSNVSIRFADGSELLVLADSEVVMDTLSSYHKTGMVDTRVRLQKGRVDTRVKPAKGPGSQYHIITPAAVAAVRGTNFRVSTEHDQPVSRSEVLEGKVNVSGDQGGQDVPGGYGTVAEKGKPPIKPRELLPAPVTAGIKQHYQRLPLQFTWDPVNNAQGYRFQIASSRDFSPLLADRETAAPTGLWHDLPDGEYVLRLRAIDDLRLEGMNSDIAFSVDARPFPPLLIEPKLDQLLRTERPALTWSEPEGVTKYHLQIASDADFQSLVHDETGHSRPNYQPAAALAEGQYYWRIASIDASGEQGPYSDSRQFEYRAAPPNPEFQEPQLDKNTLVIQWQSGAENVQYHFQFAADADFDDVIIDRIIDEPRIEMDRPIPEQYYFRAKAIASDGFAGEFSPAQKIVIPPTSYWSFLIPLLLLF